MPSFVVGVAGASGSGKTYFASRLAKELSAGFGAGSVAIIQEDYYYKDQSAIPLEDRAHTNYDHPNSMEHDLLAKHLVQLKTGKSVELPQYDYTQHTRAAATLHCEPAPVIIVEGILLFTEPILREQFDCLLFVDTPPDICLLRRVGRDMKERGRTFASVATQYQATVRPMLFAFIEPSKQWADLLVPGWKDIAVALEVVKARLELHLARNTAKLVTLKL